MDTAKVDVTITGVNDAPTANDDTATTDEDTPTTIDILGNDTDPDGDPLTISDIDTTGLKGTVTDNGDGTVTYDPAGQFNSLGVGQSDAVTFSYTIADGNGGMDTAKVDVTITGVNDAPVANDDTAATGEDSSVTIPVLANDTDVEGDTLSITGIDATGLKGEVTENADGTITYNPNGQFDDLGPNDTAVETFQYAVGDGNGGSDSATVTVTISGGNVPPTANDDQASTDEDTDTTIDVLGNDTDPDGDPLKITGVDTTGTKGTVDFTETSVRYDPAGQFEGLGVGGMVTETFTYTIDDGLGGQDVATVTVVVSGVNDDPTANDDTGSTDEDTSTTIDLLVNDVDPEGESLTVTLDLTGTTGAVTDNGDGTVGYNPAGRFDQLPAGAQMTDTFTYKVKDLSGGGDEATVTIVVGGVNDAPQAIDDTIAVPQDASFVGKLGAFDPDDGAVLTYTVTLTPTWGKIEDFDPDSGGYVYIPNAGYTGPDTFEFEVTDGMDVSNVAVVDITVEPGEQQPPVATDDQASTDEDTPLTIPGADLLANDVDPNGDPLAITWVSPSSSAGIPVGLNADGSVTYDPTGLLDFLGVGQTIADAFDYTIDDGQGGTDTATVVVTVSGVNDDPLLADDIAQTDEDTPLVIPPDEMLGNDFDPEDDPLAVTWVSPTSSLGAPVTLNPDGTVTYDPTVALNDLGLGETVTDTYDYMVDDGKGGVDTATVLIFVDGVNDPPVAQDGGFSVPQDGSYAGAMPADDPDLFDLLTWDVTSGPTHGTIVDFDPTTGTFIYEPDPGYTGPDAFDFNVTDGLEQSNTAAMAIVVNPTGQEFEAVIDNGDPGYDELPDGFWRTSTGYGGYERDYAQSAEGPGVGENSATWTFENVPSAQVAVYATWKPSQTWSRASNAPFTVFDGDTAQGTTFVDMMYAPADELAFGTSWELLGHYNVNSGTLVVELTDDADGKVIADAIYVTRTGPANAPLIGSVVVEPDPSAVGSVVTVTADDVVATDATVAGVAFYRDTDANGELDPAVDELIGTDDDGSDGWSVDYLTLGLAAGEHGYFARAVDSLGRPSNVASTTGVLVDPIAGFIIDNGDSGYTVVGDVWRTSRGYGGYDRDYDQSVEGPGIGENIATWSVGGLPDGRYEVHATWKPRPNQSWSRATNAVYAVYDNGTSLGDTTVNMTYAPVGPSMDGALWKLLGRYDIRTGMLTVELTDDADGKVIADAIHVKWIGPTDAPTVGAVAVEPVVSAAGSVVMLAAHDVTATNATVTNVAFYRDSNANGELDPASDELIGTDDDGADGWGVDYSTLGLAAGEHGYFAQAVDSLARHSNVASTTGRLVDPIAGFIIDNGDAGYATAGPIWTTSHGYGGHGSDYDQSAEGPGTGENIATWSVGGLDVGTYQVWTTWKPSRSWSRATNAPFTVFDNGADLGTTLIDMRSGPVGLDAEGSMWQSLGTYDITTGTLTVQLTDDADGKVIADAIRIEWLATP